MNHWIPNPDKPLTRKQQAERDAETEAMANAAYSRALARFAAQAIITNHTKEDAA